MVLCARDVSAGVELMQSELFSSDGQECPWIRRPRPIAVRCRWIGMGTPSLAHTESPDLQNQQHEVSSQHPLPGRLRFFRGHHADITCPIALPLGKLAALAGVKFIAAHCSATRPTAIICLLLTGCSTMQIPVCPGGHTQALPGGGKTKPVRRSRFRASVIPGQSRGDDHRYCTRMPPANDLLMMLGIAFCALESH